jgi:hypothetical protein
MKFDDLCSVAHNIADSLGSGASSLFNFWTDYVYSNALQSPDQQLEVDFLKGQVLSGKGSDELSKVLAYSPQVLGDLCQRHGFAPSSYRRLSARYMASTYGRQFSVIVEDECGRSRTTHYDGITGKRLEPGKHPPVSSARFD